MGKGCHEKYTMKTKHVTKSSVYVNDLMLIKITFFTWHKVKPIAILFPPKFNHFMCAMRYKPNLKQFHSFKN